MKNIDMLDQTPHFREFFETIAPWIGAYQHRLLTFISVEHEGFDVILRANLHLSWRSHIPQKLPFRTSKLRAGQHYLAGPPASMDKQLGAGGLSEGFVLTDGLVKFLPDRDAALSASFEARDRWSALRDPYVARLTLVGMSDRTRLTNAARSQLERELLRAGRPFSSLEEWAASYGFKLSAGDSAVIEIFAERVAWIDTCSYVREGKACVVVGIAPGVDPSEVRVKVCNAEPSGVHIEEIANGGSAIQWSKKNEAGDLEGVWHFALAHDAIIRATAIYGARVQHELELADPRALPNRARMMVEVADPGLGRLRQVLTTPNPKKQSEDFEAAVPLLLHMLGFSNAYVSALSDMKKEADVFTLSPKGDALVVECTTDVPDVEKVDKLLARVFAMRKALCTPSSRFSQERVISVLIVPQARDDIGPAARKHANDHDVVLLCREDIEHAIDRTRFAPDADAVVQDWRRNPLQRFLTGQS